MVESYQDGGSWCDNRFRFDKAHTGFLEDVRFHTGHLEAVDIVPEPITQAKIPCNQSIMYMSSQERLISTRAHALGIEHTHTYMYL